MSKEYVHPAPVRIWHWINAAAFVFLIITGLQIRFADIINILSWEDAVKIHNWLGVVVIVDYILWFVYYFATGKIRIYFPNLRTFIPASIRQAKFYGFGIFKGEPNPHHMTAENKFNAMQQSAYLGLMFILLPVQMITGLFLWQVKGFDHYINMLGGLRVVDTIHVLVFYGFVSFMFVHAYLATLGHTPLDHFKAMFTGYEDH